MSEKEKNLEEIEVQEPETGEDTAMQSKGRKNKRKKGGAGDDKLEQLQSDVTELKDKYLRLFAEFDNYKKRTIKEKLDLMRTAAQDTLVSLLPVLDDFDRAKKTADDENTQETFSEGVTMVYNKLYTILSHHGLRPMDTDGVDFDPELHEAITEIPAPAEDLKGKVIDTIEKGYYLNDKIIRYAKVVVGK